MLCEMRSVMNSEQRKAAAYAQIEHYLARLYPRWRLSLLHILKSAVLDKQKNLYPLKGVFAWPLDPDGISTIHRRLVCVCKCV